MQSLAACRCVVKGADIRGQAGPVRSRPIYQVVSVEERTPRLVYDAWPFNQLRAHIRLVVATVARVANVSSESCFSGVLGTTAGLSTHSMMQVFELGCLCSKSLAGTTVDGIKSGGGKTEQVAW